MTWLRAVPAATRRPEDIAVFMQTSTGGTASPRRFPRSDPPTPFTEGRMTKPGSSSDVHRGRRTRNTSASGSSHACFRRLGLRKSLTRFPEDPEESSFCFARFVGFAINGTKCTDTHISPAISAIASAKSRAESSMRCWRGSSNRLGGTALTRGKHSSESRNTTSGSRPRLCSMRDYHPGGKFQREVNSRRVVTGVLPSAVEH